MSFLLSLYVQTGMCTVSDFQCNGSQHISSQSPFTSQSACGINSVVKCFQLSKECSSLTWFWSMWHRLNVDKHFLHNILHQHCSINKHTDWWKNLQIQCWTKHKHHVLTEENSDDSHSSDSKCPTNKSLQLLALWISVQSPGSCNTILQLQPYKNSFCQTREETGITGALKTWQWKVLLYRTCFFLR